MLSLSEWILIVGLSPSPKSNIYPNYIGLVSISFRKVSILKPRFAGKWTIERFHSRDQQPYWITETKESICIKMSSIPGELVWYTIMAAISLFWDTNMAALTSWENALFPFKPFGNTWKKSISISFKCENYIIMQIEYTKSIKDGAYYCYCAYVLRISRYSDILSAALINTGIFLRGLRLCGESRT